MSTRSATLSATQTTALCKWKDRGYTKIQKLRICTFNVLAQCYIRSTYFPYCPSSALKWKRRFTLLKKAIEGISPPPHIFCLQECDSYGNSWLPYMTSLGYEGMYMKKTNGRKEGIALFWRKSDLILVDSKTLELNDVVKDMTKATLGIEEVLEKQEVPLCDRLLRDTVAVMAKFKWTDSKNVVIVATTHLFWDPAHPDVKLVQTHAIRKAIDGYNAFSGCNDNEALLPVIFAGDFNSMPDSLVYAYLTRFYDSALASYTKSPGGGESGEPECTNVNGVIGNDKNITGGQCGGTYAFKGTLDYIFCSPRVLPTAFETLLTLKEATTSVALPSASYGSDHLPVTADLDLYYLPST